MTTLELAVNVLSDLKTVDGYPEEELRDILRHLDASAAIVLRYIAEVTSDE